MMSEGTIRSKDLIATSSDLTNQFKKPPSKVEPLKSSTSRISTHIAILIQILAKIQSSLTRPCPVSKLASLTKRTPRVPPSGSIM